MNIDKPTAGDLPALQNLWRQAFGDTEDFIACFFSQGFSPDRCRRIKKDGVLAALYWFDCAWQGKKLAYIYGVATREDARGQGLCAALMKDTHEHLKNLGYTGAILVPAKDSLRNYYRRLGYVDFGGVETRQSSAAGLIAKSRPIDRQKYACLRRQYLPEGGVAQEGTLLDFFAAFAKFYAGSDFVLAITENQAELLGNPTVIPEGSDLSLRMPGSTPFAMYSPFGEEKNMPTCFGFALD